MNLKLACSLVTTVIASMVSPAFAQQHGTHPGQSPHLPTPTFQPTICNCSGASPSDHAVATFVQVPGAGMGVAVNRPGAPDGVGLGMVINCAGMPATSFSVRVSGPTVGGPFIAATTKIPGGNPQLGNLLFFPSTPTTGGGTIFQMQADQFAPGVVFEQIFVLDDEGPVSRVFSNPIVDGVSAVPSSNRKSVTNCNGWLFPPQPLPQQSACRD